MGLVQAIAAILSWLKHKQLALQQANWMLQRVNKFHF